MIVTLHFIDPCTETCHSLKDFQILRDGDTLCTIVHVTFDLQTMYMYEMYNYSDM